MKQKGLLAIITVGTVLYLVLYPVVTSWVMTVLTVVTLFSMLYLGWDLKTDLKRNSAVYIGLLIMSSLFLLVPMLFFDDDRSMTELVIRTTAVVGVVIYAVLREYRWKSDQK